MIAQLLDRRMQVVGARTQQPRSSASHAGWETKRAVSRSIAFGLVALVGACGNREPDLAPEAPTELTRASEAAFDQQHCSASAAPPAWVAQRPSQVERLRDGSRRDKIGDRWVYYRSDGTLDRAGGRGLTYFYSNGNKRSETECCSGGATAGPTLYWTEAGVVTRVEHYDDGELVRTVHCEGGKPARSEGITKEVIRSGSGQSDRVRRRYVDGLRDGTATVVRNRDILRVERWERGVLIEARDYHEDDEPPEELVGRPAPRRLVVRSHPRGATVYANGRWVGRTPCDYDWRGVGELVVELRAERHDTAVRTVQFGDRSVFELEVDLRRLDR